MLKTCAVLLICLAMCVEAQNPGGSGGNADPTGTGGDKLNANAFKGNCRKNNRQCDEPHTFCAPPGNDANANENSQWKCYYCYCEELTQCYFGNDNNVHCKCEGSGYVGDFCNETFCDPNPCHNNSTCENDIERCICADGYYGQYCESSGCVPNPCQNGGTCGEDPYSCDCPPDFFGVSCEYKHNPCAKPIEDETDVLCVHGVCVDGIGEGAYSCKYPEHDHCNPSPCKNGGTCVCSDGQEGATCICPAGYTGPFCGKLDVCALVQPCKNGGICVPEEGNGFRCDCIKGYTGPICQTAPLDDKCGSCATGGSGGSGKVSVSVNVDVC